MRRVYIVDDEFTHDVVFESLRNDRCVVFAGVEKFLRTMSRNVIRTTTDRPESRESPSGDSQQGVAGRSSEASRVTKKKNDQDAVAASRSERNGGRARS
jgi:hypothetical protein